MRDAIRIYLSEYEMSKFERGNLTAAINAMSGHILHDIIFCS